MLVAFCSVMRRGLLPGSSPGGKVSARFSPLRGARRAERRRTLRPQAALAARPQRGTQLALAQADRVGRDLDQLVVVDPRQAVLEAHQVGRGEPDRLVVAGCPHVGELLLAADV